MHGRRRTTSFQILLTMTDRHEGMPPLRKGGMLEPTGVPASGQCSSAGLGLPGHVTHRTRFCT